MTLFHNTCYEIKCTMNYIKELIINTILKRENITFVLFQHSCPTKYISICKNTTAGDIHYEFAKVVDCNAGIKDVIIANNTNMLNTMRLPRTSVTLPIYEFLILNRHCLDVSFHYRYGFSIDVYVIDDICIQNLTNSCKQKHEFEMTAVYKEITNETRKDYVNNVLQKLST